jgi:antitoxin component YwqK of YwqJK toxin-antitoxin module
MFTKFCLLIAVLVQAASGVQVVEEKYPNGQIKSRQEVVPGRGGMVNHGEATKYFDDGRIAQRMRYVNGVPGGPAVEYHRTRQDQRDLVEK